MPPSSPSRWRRASSAMPRERLDQVALDHRAVGADDAPGDDVGVGAGLVDQAGDEGAVARRAGRCRRRGRRPGRTTSPGRSRRRRSRSAAPSSSGPRSRRRTSQACLPQPVSSVATTGRRPMISSSRATPGAGPAYIIGWRPPCPARRRTTRRRTRRPRRPMLVEGMVGGTGCVRWNGFGSIGAQQHDVVEPDPAHRLDAVTGAGVLQQDPPVGGHRRLLVVDGQVEPDDARTRRARRRLQPASRSSVWTVARPPEGRGHRLQPRRSPRRRRGSRRRSAAVRRRPCSAGGHPFTASAVPGSSTRPETMSSTCARRHERFALASRAPTASRARLARTDGRGAGCR